MLEGTIIVITILQNPYWECKEWKEKERASDRNWKNINIPEEDREKPENQVANGREGTPISCYKHQGQILKEDAIF